MAWRLDKSYGLRALLPVAGALGMIWVYTRLASSRQVFSLPLLPPGAQHLLGTNSTGQDILAELLLGAPVTLFTALAAATLATGLGSLAGGAAGYLRGRSDTLIMRLCDIFLVLPGLPFMIVLATLMTPGALSIVIAVGATSWPPTARVVRAHVLQLREQGFVQAAQGLGASHTSIIFRHILPNSSQIILARGTLTLAGAMLAEAGLSFLGLGDPLRKSWGAMLHDAFSGGALSSGAWWWYGPPMLGLSLVVLLCMELAQRWTRPVAPRFSVRLHPRARSKPVTGQGILSLHHFSVRFANPQPGPQTALQDLNLVIQEGEKVALCGHTASGKSLILLGILGLLPPSAAISGAVCVQGANLTTMNKNALQRLRQDVLAYVPQATSLALNPVLRLGPQILEKAQRQGRRESELRREVLQLLEKMEFRHPRAILKSYPHHLSGGMRQRAAFAMALMGDFQILLADEPTKHLDATARRASLNILKNLPDKTVITVTHDLDLARQCAGRIVHIGGGLLLEDAPVKVFFEKPLHPFSQLMLASRPENGFCTSSPLAVPRANSTAHEHCPFADTCPHARGACQTLPPLVTCGPTRVRCWRYVT